MEPFDLFFKASLNIVFMNCMFLTNKFILRKSKLFLIKEFGIVFYLSSVFLLEGNKCIEKKLQVHVFSKTTIEQ